MVVAVIVAVIDDVVIVVAVFPLVRKINLMTMTSIVSNFVRTMWQIGILMKDNWRIGREAGSASSIVLKTECKTEN